MTVEEKETLKLEMASADETVRTAAIDKMVKYNETLEKEKSGLDTAISKQKKDAEEKFKAKEAEKAAADIQLEAARQNTLTAEQKQIEAMANIQKTVDELKNQNAQSKMKDYAREKLKEANIPTSWLNMATAGNTDEIDAKINTIKANIAETTKAEVAKTLKDNNYAAGQTPKTGSDVDVIADLDKKIDAALAANNNPLAVSLQFEQKRERQKALLQN